MFNINKNYAEINLRQNNTTPYIPSWALQQYKFINNFYKVCPNCGAIVPLTSKGCSECFFQFNYEGTSYAK